MNIAKALEDKYGTLLDADSKITLMWSFKRYEFKKGEFILNKGEIEKHLYYIEEGLLRFWLYDVNGKESTFQFALPGELSNAYKSLITNTPAEFYIQAITKGVLWKLPAPVMKKLYDTSLSINILARKIMEEIFTTKLEREIFLTTYNASERYRILVETTELVNVVPRKDLASFIGVTPEALSRIKRHYLTNK